ncbi:MAG: hypothetical protein HGA28_05740, partial [Anaerolineaceae bacterium]|nr:hypothetical protein [Anaerolineaceae bacterium]
MHLTIETGKVQAGQVPVKIRVDQVDDEKSGWKHRSFFGGGFWVWLAAWPRRIKLHQDVGTWLFIFALIISLATRLIGLTQYPIYFFTDEAIQTQAMVDLAANGYRNTEGILFPTYFRNGEYANLSLSVYLQWLPWLLFGKSAFVTRATSVVITLIAAVSIGILLRDAFK